MTFDQYLLDANGRHAPEVTGLNREMRMLEKHSGGWKFNYMGFFHEHPRRVDKPVVLVDEYATISGMTRTAAERIGNSETLHVRNGRLRGVDQNIDKSALRRDPQVSAHHLVGPQHTRPGPGQYALGSAGLRLLDRAVARRAGHRRHSAR